MRVLEEVKEDGGFNTVVQLTSLKAQKEALNAESNFAIKAKEEAMAKAE